MVSTTVELLTDEAQIALLYDEMYSAMIAKDRAELERVHDDSFTLTHMTGMVQDKSSYIHAICTGTLNYYSAETDKLDITVQGNTARMTGQSRVAAAVFGGGRHVWRLQLDLNLQKRAGSWRLVSARASTY